MTWSDSKLHRLDQRLAELQGHLDAVSGLTVIGAPAACCSSAAAVFAVEGGCRCCVSSEQKARG